MAFHPAGRLLAAGGDDGSIIVWELDGRGEGRMFQNDPLPVTGLAFSPDGRRLAASRGDRSRIGVSGTVTIRDVEAGQVVVRPTLHIRWSYDERIDDGLNARFGIDSALRALEHPFEYFGCIAEDGSDRHPLGAAAPPAT